MASLSRFLDKQLQLKVNREKSAVARPGERQFLGFSFTHGSDPKRRLAAQALERFQLRVRELTRTGRHLASDPYARWCDRESPRRPTYADCLERACRGQLSACSI